MFRRLFGVAARCGLTATTLVYAVATQAVDRKVFQGEQLQAESAAVRIYSNAEGLPGGRDGRELVAVRCYRVDEDKKLAGLEIVADLRRQAYWHQANALSEIEWFTPTIERGPWCNYALGARAISIRTNGE
ncbi:hypothetical protein ACR52_21525 [Pseudomonas fildesensis]|uniref:Uncharacterized protein n=1 Tax=Pseudomonas fildesensis TaxID=1674920 RepID=A0A0J8FXV5_9PSED|nr:hypothetical protein ACR52_21525 [Pseudomonas fildesensis]